MSAGQTTGLSRGHGWLLAARARRPALLDFGPTLIGVAYLTITVDDDALRRARRRAFERGESVDQYLAQRLVEYADADSVQARCQRAAAGFVDLSRELSGSTGGTGWTRAESYDEPTRADE